MSSCGDAGGAARHARPTGGDGWRAAKYPVADIEVIETGDDLLEIVAKLVSTAVEPNELDPVVADLQRKPGVRHATWEVSTDGLVPRD